MFKNKTIIIKISNSQFYNLVDFKSTDLFFKVRPFARLELSGQTNDFKTRNLFFILHKEAQVRLDWFNNVKKIDSVRQYKIKARLCGVGSNLDIKLRNFNQGFSKVNYFFDIDAPCKNGQVNIHCRRLLAGQAASLLKANIRIGALAKSSQVNLVDRSLLLSNKCTSLIEPNLEVLNYKARAYHQTAVSQISLEEIAYLNSRGLSNQQARILLAKAFIGPAFIDHLLFA